MIFFGRPPLFRQIEKSASLLWQGRAHMVLALADYQTSLTWLSPPWHAFENIPKIFHPKKPGGERVKEAECRFVLNFELHVYMCLGPHLKVPKDPGLPSSHNMDHVVRSQFDIGFAGPAWWLGRNESFDTLLYRYT